MPITVKLTDGRSANFADGTSQAEMESALRQLPAKAPTAPDKTWVDTAVDALPTLGGLAGGMIGGTGGTVAGFGVGGVPGAVGGAALGGAGGESAKELINRFRGVAAPTSSLDAAKNIGAAGAVQGGSELAGAGAAKVLEPVAKGLYGIALRPIKSIRDKYGLGNLIREGFENRVMPTAAGAEKAGALVADSKAAQGGMAQAYDAGGGQPLPIVRAARQGLSPIVAKANSGEAATGAVSGAPTVMTQAKRVIAANGPTVSATEMMGLKHAADDMADPAYAAARRTGQAVPDVSDAGIAKGWSKGYRQTLNDAVGPDFAAQGQQTKTLYGLKRAAERIAGEPHNLTNNLTMLGAGTDFAVERDPKKALEHAVAMRAAMSPGMQAGAAFALPLAARYLPRALDAAAGSNAEQYLRQALLQQLAGQDRPQ